MALTKKQMNDRINKRLGYEFIIAWELFTKDEIKDVYNKVVKQGKEPLLGNDNVYVFV